LVYAAFFSSAIAQSTWELETTVGALTLAPDGSASFGPEILSGSVNSDGFYSIPSIEAEFAVSANRDVMIGLSSSPAEAPLRILTKRPASLNLGDLEGEWQYREYAILSPEAGSAVYPIEIQSLDVSLAANGDLAIQGEAAGNAQLGSAQNVILNVGDESIAFAVNASKDFMVSLFEGEGEILLRLLVKVDNGGSTADLQGDWSLARFGIDQQVPDMAFALASASLNINASGNTSIGGEPLSLSSSGSGSVTVTDSEGTSSLVWSQSRQLLLEAESQDAEYALPIVLRRASGMSAAELADTWDLHELTLSSPELSDSVAERFNAAGALVERYGFITGSDGQRLRNGLSRTFEAGLITDTHWLADAEAGTSVKDGTATRYDFDGVTVRRREQWTLGALHGEPAVQEWDAQGRETLHEYRAAGVITRKLESSYDDIEPGNLISQTLSTYVEGEKATELRESYYSGSSALESRISLAFTNGVETQRDLVNFKIDGVTRSDDLEETFDPLTGITEETSRTYLEDGVGLLSSYFLRYSDPASPLVDIFSSYHEDGSTVSQRTTKTASESSVSILTERFYASGQESYRGTTDGDFREQGTVITWHENGNVASRTNYSNGIQHGLTEQYNAAAQPTLVATYAFGEIVESTMTTYYADGTQQFEQVTLNGDEQVITSRQWYENGQLQSQTRYVDELPDGVPKTLDGVQKTFDELGNPTSEQNYSAGALDGPSYQWHAGTAQLSTQRNYTEGLLDGESRDWFADGQLQVLRNYLSGHLNGRGEAYNQSGQPLRVESWTLDQLRSLESWDYYDDGTLQSHSTSSIRFGDLQELDAEQSVVEYYDVQGRISSYSELAYGKYHGEVRSYHDGVLMSRSQYQDGMLEGLEQKYLYLDDTSDIRFGKLVSETLYSRGLRQGVSKEYDAASGLLVKEVHYQRDLLHGTYKEYKTSILIYQGDYTYGARDGLHTSYRDDGTLQQTATYESDVLDGAWAQYHTNGNTQLRGNYDRGLKTGTWVEYWVNGGLRESTDYLADYRDGVYERWDEQSRRTLRENYRGGIRDGLSETFTAGVLSSSTVYSDGAEVGPRKEYYPNGQLASNTPLDEFGRLEGLVTRYFADGQVSLKSNFRAGLQHGSGETFYQDGPRASLTNSSAGRLNGSFRTWNSRGQLSQSGSYSDGAKCGTWGIYNIVGDLINEQNYGLCPGAGDPEFPIARGFEGVVRLNGQAVPGVYLSIASGDQFQTSINVAGDGSFRYGPLAQGSELTSFTLTVQAGPGWLEKEVNVTVPRQDGFVPVSIDLEPAENTAPIIRPLNNSRARSISFLSETYDFVSLPAVIEIPFTIADTETGADNLETTFNLSNPALFRSAELLGVGAQRYVRLTPKPDTAGNSTLTVTVSDGELSSQATAELRFAHAIVSRILRGSASVLRAGQDLPLAAGDPIFEGEIIKTDKRGLIRVKTPEGSVFTIGSDSEVQINRIEAGERGFINLIKAKVIKGFLRTEATTDPDRKLEVTTRTASIGVRGTIFEVIVDEVDGLPRTQIFVEEGLVEATDLGTGSVLQLGIAESTVIEGLLPFTSTWTALGPKSGRFDFSTDSGYVYQLEKSSDLSFAPQDVQLLDQVSGNGSAASLSYDDTEASDTSAFFRVKRIAQ
jgi:antitoxin component YwqK of YwqJK toxin-antitoxin module